MSGGFLVELKCMITTEKFKQIMQQYGEAWESLDSQALLRIFSKDATYQATPFGKPYKGHEEIRNYWENVVKTKERNVKFTLGNIFVKNNIGIAGWKANFIRMDNGNSEELRGIILIEIQNGKIKKLWEYWHKEEKVG